MVDNIKRLASFIPKTDRAVLFKQLYEAYGSNAKDLARALGINVRQIYFYLPNNGKKLRNYPNDDTISLILKTILKKNPQLVSQKMIQLSKEFSALLEDLHFKL